MGEDIKKGCKKAAYTHKKAKLLNCPTNYSKVLFYSTVTKDKAKEMCVEWLGCCVQHFWLLSLGNEEPLSKSSNIIKILFS